MSEIVIQDTTIDMAKIGVCTFKQEFGVQAILTLKLVDNDLYEFEATTKDGIAELVEARNKINKYACENPL